MSIVILILQTAVTAIVEFMVKRWLATRQFAKKVITNPPWRK